MRQDAKSFKMHYYSTSNRELRYGLKEALIKGLAPDRGLFMPASVPVLTRATLEGFRNKKLPEIALSLSSALFGEDMPCPGAGTNYPGGHKL